MDLLLPVGCSLKIQENITTCVMKLKRIIGKLVKFWVANSFLTFISLKFAVWMPDY